MAVDEVTVSGAAIYCVADDRYFVGAAALVNSLRLLGHTERIEMLDCGLTPDQRAMLEPEVSLTPAPSDAPPWLLKTVVPLQRPADVMLLLDVDMVATRSLAPLLEDAARGRVVVFKDPLDRHVAEWGELLGLGPVRRGPYVSSAAICVDRAFGGEVLELLADHQSKVDFARTFWRASEPDYPFRYADQDVLNALLATRVEADRVVVLDGRLAATPPFEGLRLRDEVSLRCSYADGEMPFLVHHHGVLPWLEPTHDGVYSRLLRRLLLSDDVPIRIEESRLPVWLRTGARAWATRMRINARERFRFHVREPLAERFDGPGQTGG
jgi:hypothetical protein